MQLIFSNDTDKLYRYVADRLLETVALKPDALLGLATGGTFEPVYGRILEQRSRVNWQLARTVNLDEYYPIGRHGEQSFYTYMKKRLFDPLGLTEEQSLVLNGEAADPGQECMDFEERIDALGGIELQVLGIGRNGHIGFNEPSDAFEPHTHYTALTDTTLTDNARYFEGVDQMPTGALTMGIETIMKARGILLLAVGRSKAQAVNALVNGKITPDLPASILRVHPNCTVLMDSEAGALLDWSLGQQL